MSMVGFPLLLIPLAVFNIMVFLMPGVSFTAPVLSVTLLSEVSWVVTVGDLMLAIAVLLLMLEVIKSARGKYLMDHLLSLLLLAGATAEFLLLPQFGNSTYFLLVLLTFVDFIAGIGLRVRRTARAAAGPIVSTPVAEPEPRESRVEPRVDSPVAASPAPPAPEPTTAPAAAPTPAAPAVVVPPAAATGNAAPHAPTPAATPPAPSPAAPTPPAPSPAAPSHVEPPAETRTDPQPPASDAPPR